jgi:hypothetical protein
VPVIKVWHKQPDTSSCDQRKDKATAEHFGWDHALKSGGLD